MQKILIIGAGVEQVKAIKLARKMGLFVIVSDMSDTAPGIKYANKFYQVSTTDANGNYEIGVKEKINGVMTICSETAVPTVATVARRLNLPGFSEDTALKATNKSEMRKALSKHKVNVAPFIITDNFNTVKKFIGEIAGPWVLKPVDSSGQRGTSIVYKKDLIKSAFDLAKQYSSTEEVLIDKYVIGPEVHVTMQVIDKEVHFLALSDRITLDDSNFGIAIRHIGPSELNVTLTESIYDICNKSIEAIGLENGVATCELILENNKAYLMEVAIRVPGGYLREVALYLSGVDILRTTILDCLGIKTSYNELVTEKYYPAVSVKFISSLNIPPKINVITEINNLDQLKKEEGIKEINLHFETNFNVPTLSSSIGRFAAIISVGNTRKEAVKKSEHVFNHILFNNQNLIEYSNYKEHNVSFSSYLK